jgi:hypothetical protein
MSAVTDELRTKAQAYRIAIFELGDAREERDTAKRNLKEIEASIFTTKVNSGQIDGKNAETRDAQAQLAFKADTAWQTAFDAFIDAEKNFYEAQDMLTITLMELRVAAILTNVEIAQTGATRLLSETSLAGA